MTKSAAPAKAVEIREVMFSSLPGDLIWMLNGQAWGAL
jgi:hypothetical protein